MASGSTRKEQATRGERRGTVQKPHTSNFIHPRRTARQTVKEIQDCENHLQYQTMDWPPPLEEYS